MKVKAPSKESLQKAHDEGCSDVRKALQNLYPDFFKKSQKDIMKDIINDIGKTCHSQMVVSESTYIKIPLPNNNDSWTFEAFDYAKRLCDKYPKCFVRNYGMNEKDNSCLYIECKNQTESA